MSVRPVTGADYKPEDIISLLAAHPAPSGEYVCALCGEEPVGTVSPMELETHDAECPWRLAREWAAANITIG